MNFVKGVGLNKRLEELMIQSNEIDIAVAWVTKSTLLSEMLDIARNSKTKIRMVTGVGNYLTDPALLRHISTIVDELKIYGEPKGPLYHPKLYIFRKGPTRTVLVGSANLTGSALSTNVESVFEFKDSLGASINEFDRFWNSDLAVTFAKWNLQAYEAERKAVMDSFKTSGGGKVLPEEVLQTLGEKVDVLKSGWDAYVSELKSIGKDDPEAFGLRNWLEVLEHGTQLINRDWDRDLTDDDLKVMYGKKGFSPFGSLNPIHQGKFLGRAGKKTRRILGEGLREAAAMKSFHKPLVEKVFDNLCSLDGCGPALVSRLLVLARPDIFVVVNKKSFEGLQDRFGIPVPQKIKSKPYAELLKRIQEQPWCRSTKPSNPDEIKLWQNRTALVDLLVYREHSEVDDK